ncbi:hypothetical protein PMV51_15450 [Enterococcus avium]|uniref:TerB-C domain-containing protein n=1 Tax=Enterococcus avium ATCC 14025 TaxID=1140002 RepID=A0AAV3IVB4_ENTAV|nr:hypothetical protein [Enterococcus avium]EOT45716.1 hypothetical protein OMU_02140 [Enterococcus avium ATCC 14025]EOU16879.1 hypothetical protein I570_04028 [Enterococcus avium ATCC 14025]MDB1750621.1 hypothetical protein [Enterococcus avium]MDB1754627.1 hypothetical protein [Enterococcus avium]MDB1761751.1 hypothetical protein [Enterococcus avium]
MERAVLLSDIEFLDGVHESDWERIEEESFLVNVSKPLNENQQVVLEWLKDDFKESGNPVDSLESLASEVLHVETFQTCISSTYDELSISEQFQVLQAFAEWGKEKVMK